MLLDDLVTAIQAVQTRIHEHGNTLSQNEYRTRISLIDPILNALGWDVSDPSQVMLEYPTGEGRADYALLDSKGEPIAFIEAKHLGKMRDAVRHETQLITYAVTRGVRYAGLTDGNRWVFENLIARFERQERRLLDVTISEEPTDPCVAKLLWLWNLTSEAGRATKPKEPALTIEPEDKSSSVKPCKLTPVAHPKTEQQLEVSEEYTTVSSSPLSISPPSTEWISLISYDPKLGMPTKILLPNQSEIQIRNWPGLLVEIAEWLIRKGLLTGADCPVPSAGRNQHHTSLINITAHHENGSPMGKSHKLINGFYLNKGGSAATYLNSGNYLLRHFQRDPASIFLKSS